MTCIIRPDIIKDGYMVRVGNVWLCSAERFEYRWVDDQFQILFDGDWCNADSVDFQF